MSTQRCDETTQKWVRGGLVLGRRRNGCARATVAGEAPASATQKQVRGCAELRKQLCDKATQKWVRGGLRSGPAVGASAQAAAVSVRTAARVWFGHDSVPPLLAALASPHIVFNIHYVKRHKQKAGHPLQAPRLAGRGASALSSRLSARPGPGQRGQNARGCRREALQPLCC